MTDYTPSTDEVRAAWLVDNSRKEAVKAGPVLDGFDRWLAEEKRAAAENAVEQFRTELCKVLTAPDPDLSLTVGGQEYLATSIISTLLDEQDNPHRRNES